jgi:hypothetical protein
MIKIIEDALKNLSGMQLNLESNVARTWIAQKVEKAITEHQQQSENTIVDNAELNRNTTMEVDDVIVSAMKAQGYTKSDSGYNFRSGKRDITFIDSNNKKYEVTFRQLNYE